MNNMSFKNLSDKTKETIISGITYTIIGLLIAVTLALVSKFTWVSFFFINNSQSTWNGTTTITINNQQTPDVTNTSFTTGDLTTTGIVIDSGNTALLQPIDIVYQALASWEAKKDYSILKFPPQDENTKSNWWLNYYLNTNAQSLDIPKDIIWGYLYIRLHSKAQRLWAADWSTFSLQPLNIRTNKYFWNLLVWGRLELLQSFKVYLPEQEFVFDLKNIPIRYAKWKDRTQWTWTTLKIWWVVSTVNGNYIETMAFIWKR